MKQSFAGSRNILVVEDNEELRMALCELLRLVGFRVTAAQNGAEALALGAMESRPDLIFLDLMMPVMDGFEFLEARKQAPALASVPVVVLSGMANARERLGDRLPGLEVLAKPTDFDELLHTVERLLGH